MLKKGQVWVETVLYTIMWLALIGLVLAFAYPRINAIQEKALIEQSISSLQSLDSVITLVEERGPGNVKSYYFYMKRGELLINATDSTGDYNYITLVLSGLKSMYSQPGVEISQGRIYINNTKEQKTYTLRLKMKYQTNLTYEGRDIEKKFVQSQKPYQFFISNKGSYIDISE